MQTLKYGYSEFTENPSCSDVNLLYLGYSSARDGATFGLSIDSRSVIVALAVQSLRMHFSAIVRWYSYYVVVSKYTGEPWVGQPE